MKRHKEETNEHFRIKKNTNTGIKYSMDKPTAEWKEE
jgi:hypothetical protein